MPDVSSGTVGPAGQRPGSLGDCNAVIVDVGQVDEQVASLWWALARQTARVARDQADGPPETQSTARRRRLAGHFIPPRSGQPAPVVDRALSRADSRPTSSHSGPVTASSSSSSSRSSSRSSAWNMSSATPMSSPRLVREISQKFDCGAAAATNALTPLCQSYVYEAPEADTSGHGGVQLLRYVRVAHSSSVEHIPPAPTPTPTGALRASMRRPKSQETASRKLSDTSVQHDDASSSVECVQFDGNDHNRGADDDDPAANYAPIVVVVIITIRSLPSTSKVLIQWHVERVPGD